jgi:lysophospholipase L1-like esterase
MRRRIERIVVVASYLAFSGACLFGVAELGVRTLGWGERPDPLAGRIDMEAYSYFDWRQEFFADLGGAAYSYLYEPFSLWKHQDFESGTLNVRDGYRVTWVPTADVSAKIFTIYAFGGSTLFGAEGPDVYTVPSYLAKNLDQRDDGFTYVVRNYAVSGFTSDNEVHLLVQLLRDGHRPDAIVFYDGVNDIYYKSYLGVPHYLYENFRALGAVSSRDLLSRAAARSRLVSLWRDRRPKPTGIRDRTALEEKMPAVLGNYFGNVELVRALGASYSFESHFFWQPTLFSTAKKLTAEEQNLREKYKDFAMPYKVANVTVTELLSQHRIHDLRHALDDVPESIFVDFCHITALGNQAVAEAMTETIEGFL